RRNNGVRWVAREESHERTVVKRGERENNRAGRGVAAHHGARHERNALRDGQRRAAHVWRAGAAADLGLGADAAGEPTAAVVDDPAAVGAFRLAGDRRAWSADVVDTAAATRLRQCATAAVERVVAAVIESAAILGERCAGDRRADGCRDYGAIRRRLVGDEVFSGADDNGAVAGHC